jgi:hypothetical protein
MVYGLETPQCFLRCLDGEIMVPRILFTAEVEQLVRCLFGVRVYGRHRHPSEQIPTEDQAQEEN